MARKDFSTVESAIRFFNRSSFIPFKHQYKPGDVVYLLNSCQKVGIILELTVTDGYDFDGGSDFSSCSLLMDSGRIYKDVPFWNIQRV